MDDLTQKRLARAIRNLPQPRSDHPPIKQRAVPPKNKLKGWGFLAAIATFSIVAGLLIYRPKEPATPAPQATIVPASIRQQASFPIFYPDPQKLPGGYSLDKTSFSGNAQAVVYSVTYDTNKKIAFTVQQKPSDSELKAFYANQIPLRQEVKVPAGTAVIGVLNNQTLVSLPTETNAWLLITAPLDINQEQLQEVIKAIKQ